jgi:hypothetical protein
MRWISRRESGKGCPGCKNEGKSEHTFHRARIITRVTFPAHRQKSDKDFPFIRDKPVQEHRALVQFFIR